MGAKAWYKEEILAMLCWIAILGGVLIMMGQHSRSEALFYYFRLEDQAWRELAFFNNGPRFEEIKGLLKAKYATRFKSLTPTPASIEWLSGDNLGTALRLSHT